MALELQKFDSFLKSQTYPPYDLAILYRSRKHMSTQRLNIHTKSIEDLELPRWH